MILFCCPQTVGKKLSSHCSPSCNFYLQVFNFSESEENPAGPDPIPYTPPDTEGMPASLKLALPRLLDIRKMSDQGIRHLRNHIRRVSNFTRLPRSWNKGENPGNFSSSSNEANMYSETAFFAPTLFPSYHLVVWALTSFWHFNPRFLNSLFTVHLFKENCYSYINKKHS